MNGQWCKKLIVEKFRALQITDTVTYWWYVKPIRNRVSRCQISSIRIQLRLRHFRQPKAFGRSTHILIRSATYQLASIRGLGFDFIDWFVPLFFSDRNLSCILFAIWPARNLSKLSWLIFFTAGPPDSCLSDEGQVIPHGNVTYRRKDIKKCYPCTCQVSYSS